jgi:hypothetical protein
MENQLEQEIDQILSLEKQIQAEESELMQDEKFRAFLTKQKEAKEQIASFWKTLEEKMIEQDIQSIKGDWGYITIAKRLNWNTDGSLAPRFYKKVVNTTLLSSNYKLTGEAPKGATPYYIKYLTKKVN